MIIAGCSLLLAAGIVLPPSPSASQKYAAEEFDRCCEVKGGKLVLETAAPEEKLGEDGFRLFERNGDLVVRGSAKRGCLYGVYEALERFGGVRWYSSWCMKMPKSRELQVPRGFDITERPDFEMRQPFWADVLEHRDFSARLRVNGYCHSSGGVDEKFGGDSYRFGGGLPSCHTFETLVPVEKYYRDHPEYFSLINGRRCGEKGRTQLCLTNPDVLKLVVSNVLERIRQDPGAKFYGVSQNDWYNACECPNCKAIDDEEESWSGTMVRFVNAVAEEVEKEFPDVLIETLAYQYTRKPPKFAKLRHNVVPCLCTIECDFGHPLATGTYKENVSFRKDIQGWAKQTSALYVWDYVTDFAAYPGIFPNGGVLQDNLRFFRDNGVKMIFEQGCYQGHHANYAELKAWLLAKLMWKVDQPLKPLLDDFFEGYYGKAADIIRKDYEESIAYYAAKPDIMLSIYDKMSLEALPLEYFVTAEKRRVEALKIAETDDEVHRYNVRMWTYGLDYTNYLRTKSPTVTKRVLDARVAAKGVISTSEGWQQRIREEIETLALGHKAADVSTGRQLFVDDYLVRKTDNVVRHWNTPVKHDKPILRDAMSTDGGLWWDAKAKKYRLWYEKEWTGHLRYAESKDGVSWEMPDLGVVKGTNRVFEKRDLDSWNVWPDYQGEDPYAKWNLMISSPGITTFDTLYTSTDGMHFTKLGVAGWSGDRSSMYFDPFRNEWVYSLRDFLDGFSYNGNPIRRTRRRWTEKRFEVPDLEYAFFINGGVWADSHATPELWKELMLKYGEPDEKYKRYELYSFDAAPYESLMVGMMEVLANTEHDNGDCEKVGLPKQTHIRYSFSRDGRKFTLGGEECAIRPSGWGSGKWDTGYLSAMGGFAIVTPDELRIHYTGLRGDPATKHIGWNEGLKSGNHNGMYRSGSIGYATLRRDGFAGMVADGDGTLVTVPITFTGKHLFINGECLYGRIAAELVDREGRVIPGFSAADCEAFAGGDRTKTELRFKGGDLAQFGKEYVTLRFKMYNATLYSFWISPSERGESCGYLAAGGPDYDGLRDEVKGEEGK